METSTSLAARNNIMDTEVQEVLASLTKQITELSAEWNEHPLKTHLVTQIRQQVLPQKNLHIDSALCLGLWSPERSTNLDSFSEDYESEDYEDPRVPLSLFKSHQDWVNNHKPNVAKRNRSLFQLLIFETIIECLRERFTINTVRFQDPQFTAADAVFLEQRGYTVVPFPGENLSEMDFNPPPDQELLDSSTSSTFFYAPYLPCQVAVEVIYNISPPLYLGNNLYNNIMHDHLYNPYIRTWSMMEEFESYVLTRDYVDVEAFPFIEGCLMWKADMSDAVVAKRLHGKWDKVTEAGMIQERWRFILEVRAIEGAVVRKEHSQVQHK